VSTWTPLDNVGAALTPLQRLATQMQATGTIPDGGPEVGTRLLADLTSLVACLPPTLDGLRAFYEREWDGSRLVHVTGRELSATVAVGGVVVDLDAAGEAAHALARHLAHATGHAAHLRRPSDG
jgi:hypothetical protein